MVAIGGNPMDYFQAGRAGGAARSPVSGIGSAIRGVLEQGKRLGLIQAQTQGNLMTGLATTGVKQQLQQAYDQTPTTTPYYSAEGEKIKDIKHLRGQKPVIQKPVSAAERMAQMWLAEELQNKTEDINVSGLDPNEQAILLDFRKKLQKGFE